MRLPIIASLMFLISITQSHAQSAIETMVFFMTGLEINAPENRFSGALPFGKDNKGDVSIETSDGCNFTIESKYKKIKETIDFSRVTEINLKGINSGSFTMHYAQTSGLDESYCAEPQGGKRFCRNWAGGIEAIGFKTTEGSLNDKSVSDAVVKIFTRKQAAYKYFREKYCKPRAF